MKTKVLFRRFHQGDLIALFPEEPADNQLGHCSSYQSIGQHGAASVDLGPYTVPATLAEPDVAALAKELERVGYEIQPVHRITAAMHRKRLAAITTP